MELYLQFGWQMTPTCLRLLGEWGAGTVILSPRDLDPRHLGDAAERIRAAGGKVLVDPQLYTPHETNFRLSKHSFWPGCAGVCDVSAPEWGRTIRELRRLNTSLGAHMQLLPGVICSRPEDLAGWRTQLLRVAEADDSEPADSLMTVAVGHQAMADTDTVHAILDTLDETPYQNFYVVPEYPPGSFFVGDPWWLSNLLDLSAGCALKKGTVVVGYCAQQMLVLAASGVTAVASGTFQNLRQFGLQRFRNPESDTKQRAKWYYSPPALSEYKVTYLDVAARRGVLQTLHPGPGFPTTTAERLFTAPAPMSAPFSYPDAYEHFLICLRHQAMNATLSTFSLTVATLEEELDTALQVADSAAYAGVRGEHKQFGAGAHAASMSALATLRADRMPILSRAWPELPVEKSM